MKISEFLSENSQFLVMTFSIYLNRRVFIMLCKIDWICSDKDIKRIILGQTGDCFLIFS